jgi:acyl dehydratase
MLKENEIKVGDTHSSVLVEDLKRTQIVQYAGASGDYNPLHTDEIFTTQIAGYPSVFAHGMLSMGLTGTMLTDYVGVGALKKYGVRFTNQVWPGDTLTGKATIIEIRQEDDGKVVDLMIETTNQDNVSVITGNATAKIES